MSNLTKKISISLIVLFVSSAFWLVVKPWIVNPLRLSLDLNIWFLPLALFVLLIATVGLALTLLKEGEWRLIVVLSIAGPYLAVFGISSRFYLLAVLLMMLTSWLAIHYFVAGSTQRLKINIYHIMQHGLPWLVTGILVLITFAYFLSPKIQATAETQTLSPGIQKIIEKTITTISGEQIEGLSPQQKQNVISQATVEVTKQFTTIAKPYLRYLPSLLALGLFLVLQGLSFIFVFLACWLSVLLFKILKASGFVKVVEKEVKAETIELV